MTKLPVDTQLPKVYMDVFSVVQNEINRSGNETAYYTDIAQNLKEQNPLIFNLMVHFSQEAIKNGKDLSNFDVVHKAVLLTYKLLETQIDVRNLSNEFLTEELQKGDDSDGAK